MIEVQGLTKRYGNVRAVTDLSFTVAPGRVTGFLGPNGAGKSTTMRMMLGLDRANAGRCTFDGKQYSEFTRPALHIGVALDPNDFHRGRSARSHLQWIAAINGLSRDRINWALQLVGLSDDAGRRVGGFSTGMKQRLSIAGALLGDPPVILCDEPANGLDPAGINWLRQTLRYLASEGRTVFVSSHQLAEMAQTADDLVVIRKGGHLVAQTTLAAFVEAGSTQAVDIRSPQAPQLAAELTREGATVQTSGSDAFIAGGISPERVGEIAAAHGFTLYLLTPRANSLEDVFLRATADLPAPPDPPQGAN